MSFHFDENDNESGISLNSDQEKNLGQKPNPFAPKKPVESTPAVEPEKPQISRPVLPSSRPAPVNSTEPARFSLPVRPPVKQEIPVRPPVPTTSVETAVPAAEELTEEQRNLREMMAAEPVVDLPLPQVEEETSNPLASTYTEQPYVALTPVPEAPAVQPPAPAQVAAPTPDFNPPASILSQPNGEPEAKKGFWKPREKPVKKEKASKGKTNSKASAKKNGKEKPKSDYAGGRQATLIIRFCVMGFALLFVIVGLKSAFIGNGGPTPAQVTAAAQKSVNYTGFPTQSGAVFASNFIQQFMTYNSDEDPDKRRERLQNFVSSDLLQDIDITKPTEAEYNASIKGNAAAGRPVVPYSDLVIDQKITGGPFVVDSNNLKATSAVFTVKVQINNEKWDYIAVPVKYVQKNQSLTLAGPISFVKPIQNVGSTDPDEYTVTFAGTDDAAAKSFQPDLESYLTAWAESDKTIINRYVVDDATQDAKSGLKGAVDFVGIDSLTIEALDAKRPQTQSVRRVEFTVTWMDPDTKLNYAQQYRMIIQKNPDNKWSVYDIQNFAVLN